MASHKKEEMLVADIMDNKETDISQHKSDIDSNVTTKKTENTEEYKKNKKGSNIHNDSKNKGMSENTNAEDTKLEDNSIIETKAKATYFNPYAKSVSFPQAEDKEIPQKEKTGKDGEHKKYEENNHNNDGKLKECVSTAAKRNMSFINIMNTLPKKKAMTTNNNDPVHLLVQGYAFHDDIIGVAHRRNDGGEAYNLVLRNMLFNKELEEDGFSAYVALRDASSGKDDKLLLNKDGYPKFLFLSINVHHFNSAHEANNAVIEQCQKLQTIASDPTHNIFNYPYKPITDMSNITGEKLLVLSDVIRFADAFRIFKHLYGDNTYRHNLEADFGQKHPDVIRKYFSNIDEIPDYIKAELGL